MISARSSAEAELHAAALGASESPRIVSLLCDLGSVMKSVLASDAKATAHTLHRQGVGRVTHRCRTSVDTKRSQVQEVESTQSRE